MKRYPLLLFVLVFTGGCSRRYQLFPWQASVPASVLPQPTAQAAEIEDSGEIKDAAELFLRKRALPGETSLPWDRYGTAREHIKTMPQIGIGGIQRTQDQQLFQVSGGNAWTPLGPGNIGGRTRSILINPQNPSIMYAGAVTGGVWKSIDAGSSWAPLTDLLPVLNVGSLVMDPSHPDTIYAGTGEFYTGFQGQGIFKSTDGGTTWLQLPQTNNSNFVYVNKMTVSANNPQHVYAATSAGVWRSLDGGNTWTQMLDTTQASNGCEDLVMRTDVTTDYLLGACTTPAGASSYAIWRNTDAAGGASWTQVFTAQFMGRTSLALAPSMQSTVYAMAASQGAAPSSDQALLAVYRSTSNGDPGSWVARTTNTNTNPLNTSLLSTFGPNAACGNSGGDTYSQGTYDNVIVVDPKDPEKVWAGGIFLFRSDDGGANWGLADIGTYLHADQHSIVFHPNYDGVSNQTMFEGNDGGLYRTDSARATTITSPSQCNGNNGLFGWKNLNNSYAATQFYHGSVYPGGTAYFGGSQDNGTSRGSDSGGTNGWKSLGSGDGGATAIDPFDSSTIFASGNGVLLKSSDGGITFYKADSGIEDWFDGYLAMDPNNGKTLFWGGNTTLWRSLDGGASWTAAAPVESSSLATAIAVSPNDSNTVLFGTQKGYIYRSSAALTSSGGPAWSSAQPRNGYIGGLAFDPSNPNTVYATYSSFKFATADSHVYKSTDGGATWMGLDGTGSGTLPDLPMFRLIVDPRIPTNLYLGSDLGVFVTTDGGTTWAHDPQGPPNAIVEDLTMDRDMNWLFAFTYGRGVYRVPLPSAPDLSCSFTVSPLNLTLSGFGGVLPVSVTAPPGCAWFGLPGSTVGVQAPAQGTGHGTAYVTAPANFSGAISDTVTIAGRSVLVDQTPIQSNQTLSDSPPSSPASLPFAGTANTRTYTSGASDPVHSCTGSADYTTAWFSVIPSSSGILQVTASSQAFANSGIVVSAYAAGAPTVELACGTATPASNAPLNVSIQVTVTAGTAYLIEISDTKLIGQLIYAAATLTQPTTVSVSPQSATLGPGGTLQFTATVTGPLNTAVRWTLRPALGTISSAGLYTPPPALASSPTNLTVTITSFADTTKTATATLALESSLPFLAADGIVNAASFQGSSGVSPGEIVTIFGSRLGPSTLAASAVTASGFDTTAGGTQVLFDGRPAPMIYSVSGQVTCIVPYEVAGQSRTTVTLVYEGEKSNTVTAPVVASAPGLFTANSTGAAAMLNGDGTVNSPMNPAARTSTVVFFATGEGQTNPAGVDGQLNNSPPYPQPLAGVSMKIGGQSAQIVYAGAAPSLVAGVLQVNAVVPADIMPGNAVPVVLSVGGLPSTAGVTISVK